MTLAIPVPLWRTGRQPLPPLQLDENTVSLPPARVWIDTDAACGHTARTDPDDCLALLMLSRASIGVAGISTVHGNAPLDVTYDTTRALIALLEKDGVEWPAVHAGAAVPGPGASEASTALATSLAHERLLVLALGPLTNIAAALADRPSLWPQVAAVVAVMGRRPGHIFHPAEGAGAGSWLGHGPIFRDFNVAMDPDAVGALLRLPVPLFLVPYEAAHGLEFTPADLDMLRDAGGASAWVAERSRPWLDYWRADIGRAGFSPFDVLASAFVVDPARFACASVTAWMGNDPTLFVPFWKSPALMVAQSSEHIRAPDALGRARYCPSPGSDFRTRLMRWLLDANGQQGEGTQ